MVGTRMFGTLSSSSMRTFSTFHISTEALLCLQFSDRYEAGDVAVIHPEASDVDVESFLNSLGWANVADDPFIIEPKMTGTLHDWHLFRSWFRRRSFGRPVSTGPPSTRGISQNSLHSLPRLQRRPTANILSTPQTFYHERTGN